LMPEFLFACFGRSNNQGDDRNSKKGNLGRCKNKN
jgi:hypothetical protein